jgi:hypothetical protein
MPRRLLALIPVAILIVACGGSGSPTTNVSTAANAEPTTTAGSGGGASAGIPTIADGQYKSGTTHVELSGGRSDTFDLRLATGITSGGDSLFAFTSADNQKIVRITFLAPGSSDTGTVSVTSLVAPNLLTVGGTWGQECQIKITRNNGSGLSGEFSCKDAPSVTGTALSKADLKGTFSADR